MSNQDWVMPIYLVFDPVEHGELSLVSFANELISKVFREIHSDPVLDLHVRARIIEATEQATSLIPLSQMSSLIQIPGIVQSQKASLDSAFVNLKQWITDDVTSLKQEGLQVFRPNVFVFLGRSEYGDEWKRPFQELTDRVLFRFAPNIFCFGTNIVPSNVIWEIASLGTSELKTAGANVMDGSVGIDVLSKSVGTEFVTKVIRSPLHARNVHSREFEVSPLTPGITPVDIHH